MRKLYLTLIVLMVAGIAAAQSTSFTLEQCIDYALSNNYTIQNSKLDERSAAARIKEVTGLGMPQVSGNVTLTNNKQLNRFFGMKSRIYGFSGLADPNSPNYVPYDQFFPELKDDDVLASANFFQLKNSGTAGLTINQLIFNGSYFVGLQAANALKELNFRKTIQSKVDVVDQVSKAFYLALINRERISLFNNNINRVDTLLRNTRALNQNGFAESIDIDRLQVTLNNLVTEKEKFAALQTLSIEALKFQMGYPMDQPLEITGSINDVNPVVSSTDYSKDWDYSSRFDYQVLESNRKLQFLNIRNNYATGLPVLSAFANMGYSTQSGTFGGLFRTDSKFNAPPGMGPDKWYPYSNFGFSLNVPVFGGLQLKNKIQQEKISLLKIENSIKQTKSGIDLEIKTALVTYQNAVKSMESQKQNMELSSKVARVTKIKYEQGVGSNIEVLEAENTLKESQVNYYNALYDALVAKVNLDKAYGKLLPESKN